MQQGLDTTMTKLNGYFNPKKHVTSSEKTTAQFATRLRKLASTSRYCGMEPCMHS